MINHHHILAAVASERRNTLLAEAEAARRAKEARSHRQRPRVPGARRSPLRWVQALAGVRPDPSAPRDAVESAAERLLHNPRAAQPNTVNS